jgi:protein SCO1
VWRNNVMRIVMAVLLFSASVSVARAASWIEVPPFPDVAVQDQDGKPLKFYTDLVRGRTVFINFIFTGCSTVCPPQTAILRDVRRRLNTAIETKNVLLISVSVDPLNDSPQQLTRFAKKFELTPGLANGWVFVTGTSRDMTRLLAAFGTNVADPNEHSSLAWLGNDAKKRWTRTSALNSGAEIAQLLREVAK